MAVSGRGRPAERSSRRARGSLSEEEILDCARELVDRDGLAGLSMPVLAKRLGSGVTSIYWYFRSKEDLLDALTDRTTSELSRSLPPIGKGPWKDELVEYFASFRQLLEDTPIYREMFAYRPRGLFARSTMAPAMLRRLESSLALLVRAGFTPDEAADAFNACSNFTRGFVLLEHGYPDLDVGEYRPQVDPEEFVTVNRLSDFDNALRLDDEQFLFGLRALVDGLAIQLRRRKR